MKTYMSNIFKRSETHQHNSSSKTHSMFNVARDWIVLFCTVVCLGIGIVVFGVYMFFHVAEGTFFTNKRLSNITETSQIHKQDLDNIIGHYEQKQKRFNEFSSSATTTLEIFDPS